MDEIPDGFDTTLATQHLYLGNPLAFQEPNHEGVVDYVAAGALLQLPLFVLDGVTLFPGATLPMSWSFPGEIAAFNRAMEHPPYLVGVIWFKHDEVSGVTKMNKVGTTAKIKRYLRFPDNSISFIAVGQRRFILDRVFLENNLLLYADVRILDGPNEPPRAPREAVGSAFHPRSVYNMFDPYALGRRAIELWRHVIRAPSLDTFVSSPELLSYNIGSKIPMSNIARQELLEINGTSYRLRKEIDLLQSFDTVTCKNCSVVLARRNDLIGVSIEGPIGIYATLNGSHEIITVIEQDLDENSAIIDHGALVGDTFWFPGAGWNLAHCRNCGAFLGWHFVDYYGPSPTFWGLQSTNVVSVR